MRIAFCDDDTQELELLLDLAARYGKKRRLHIEPHSYANAESLLADPCTERMEGL